MKIPQRRKKKRKKDLLLLSTIRIEEQTKFYQLIKLTDIMNNLYFLKIWGEIRGNIFFFCHDMNRITRGKRSKENRYRRFDWVSTNYFTSDGVKNQRDERGTSTWSILKNSTCPEVTMATARNESCFPNSISFIEMRWFFERAQRSPQMAGPRWKVKIYAISHPQNGPGTVIYRSILPR